jgi:hypothetical protein
MRADICEPNDAAAVARFMMALHALGAVSLKSHHSALRVDLHRFLIGTDELSVFTDSWSIDIEGPAEIVERLIASCRPA